MNLLRRSRPLLIGAVLLACPLGFGGEAFAHAHLKSELPAANATVASPGTLRLTFSEALELRFSSVELRGPQGKVATGAPTLDPQDAAVLVIPVPAALPPGRYSVDWHATAADTHKTHGTYGFTVAP
jgi:methionine-rich copper-binding protein CopC